jgi:hypothetical protein
VIKSADKLLFYSQQLILLLTANSYIIEQEKIKGRDKLNSVYSQGLSDAILNENFELAELLIDYLQTDKKRNEFDRDEFSIAQILTALFTLMNDKVKEERKRQNKIKSNNTDSDNFSSVVNFNAALNERFMKKILALNSNKEETYGSKLVSIAHSTIVTHGQTFCKYTIERIQYYYRGEQRDDFNFFNKYIDCFTEEQLLKIFNGDESEHRVSHYLFSEKVSPKTFALMMGKMISWRNKLNERAKEYDDNSSTICWSRISKLFDIIDRELDCESENKFNHFFALEKLIIFCENFVQVASIGVEEQQSENEEKILKLIRDKIFKVILMNDTSDESKNIMTMDNFIRINFTTSSFPLAVSSKGNLEFDIRYRKFVDKYKKLIRDCTSIYPDLVNIIFSYAVSIV